MNDLIPIISAVIKKGQMVVMLIVDSGPDWNVESLLNVFFYMKLWRDTGLDMLCATNFAARYSAYNPIEHLWSPLSNKLTSVQFNAVADGDSKPPCQTYGISEEERSKKEGEVFDRAIKELCDVHWRSFHFDGFEVKPLGVDCIGHKPSPYDDHDDVALFLKATLRDLRSPKFKKYREEADFLIKHADRRKNELVLLKCESSNCSHCQVKPFQAKSVLKFLQERNMSVFTQ